MKIGDIVAVKNLPGRKPLFLRGTIYDYNDINGFFIDGKPDEETAMGWFKEENLLSLNCSIGNSYNRYYNRTLYPDYHQLVDKYRGIVVGEYRGGTPRWL